MLRPFQERIAENWAQQFAHGLPGGSRKRLSNNDRKDLAKVAHVVIQGLEDFRDVLYRQLSCHFCGDLRRRLRPRRRDDIAAGRASDQTSSCLSSPHAGTTQEVA